MLITLMLACTHHEPPPAPPAPPTPPLTTLQVHMTEQLVRVAAAREATLNGQLETARGELRWLMSHPSPEGLPEGWELQYARLRTAAQAGAEAQDPADLALAMGQVGAICGDCHQNAGVKPPLPDPPEPSEEPGVAKHMARYRFAMDRLWEGLIVPDDARWARGAAGFDDAAVTTMDLTLGDEELAHEAEDLAERVNIRGREAGGAMGQTARGVAYGELLGACAECHSLVR